MVSLPFLPHIFQNHLSPVVIKKPQAHSPYVLEKPRVSFYIPIKLQSWREKWNGLIFFLNVR